MQLVLLVVQELSLQDKYFDTVIPQFDTLVPQDTNITVDAKFTTGRSFLVQKLDLQKIQHSLEI